MLRNNEFVRVMVEGKIKEKRRRERPRITFCDQIKEKIKLSSYRKIKELARDREELRVYTDKSMTLK